MVKFSVNISEQALDLVDFECYVLKINFRSRSQMFEQLFAKWIMDTYSCTIQDRHQDPELKEKLELYRKVFKPGIDRPKYTDE